MSFKITMKGDKDLSRLLSEAPKAFQLAADAAAEQVCQRIKLYAEWLCPVKTGYLRSTIYYARQGGGYGGRSIASFAVGAKAPYARYVEFGTRFMTPRMFMRNAFLMVRPDIVKIQNEQIMAYWRAGL